VQDVLLLIEVADSSLAFDQGTKRDLYARFGVGEYWVVDIAP
jgi:Uma2 family endonuclease